MALALTEAGFSSLQSLRRFQTLEALTIALCDVRFIASAGELGTETLGPLHLAHLHRWILANPVPRVAANQIPVPPDPSAHEPLKKAKKRSFQEDFEPLQMEEGATVQDLKKKLAELNPKCSVRIRARDQIKGRETVRLGCKHVQGPHPCKLQVYCDIIEQGGSADRGGSFTDLRRYSRGTCAENNCVCCSCPLNIRTTDTAMIYECICTHRLCITCVSVMVISATVGENASTFVSTKQILCSFCNDPLDMQKVVPLLTLEAHRAYQSALCTVAAIESETITEQRVKRQLDEEGFKNPGIPDPIRDHFLAIENMILPMCPRCKKVIPDFDGCCALQCGTLSASGRLNPQSGCGAHVCAWCQQECVDGQCCHQHVLQCWLNPTGELYPPNPHPTSWRAIAAKVGLHRVWLYVTSHGCDESIWQQIAGRWPELFEHIRMPAFLAIAKHLLDAVDNMADDRTHFFGNFGRYVQTYEGIKHMEFEADEQTICRLIIVARADAQSVVNALLALPCK